MPVRKSSQSPTSLATWLIRLAYEWIRQGFWDFVTCRWKRSTFDLTFTLFATCSYYASFPHSLLPLLLSLSFLTRQFLRYNAMQLFSYPRSWLLSNYSLKTSIALKVDLYANPITIQYFSSLIYIIIAALIYLILFILLLCLSKFKSV